MISWITATFGESAMLWVGSTGAVALAWGMKKIPNDMLKAKFGGFMYGLGVACTLGLAKWKITKSVWNKTIEPYIIDAVDNIVVTGVSRFVEGLRSDN
jgi:uncharacterized membrane protein YfcA